MRVFYMSLLFCVLLLEGCIGEDMDSCPQPDDNNLILEFTYTDKSAKDAFSDRIQNVEVFIFGKDGYFVRKQSVSKASLSSFEGTALSLPPSTYRIVCWGNILGHTIFSELNTNSRFEEAYTENAAIQGNTTATSGDPLFYAPWTGRERSLPVFMVTIPEKGGQTATIPFTCAHMTIEVYVRGFADQSATGEALTPVVELTDVSAGYDFDMQVSASSLSYKNTSSWQTTDGLKTAYIGFYTPIFKEDTPIEVLIRKASDGSIVTTVSLKDFIKENNITIDSKGGQIIPVMIEYKESSVEITFPEWEQKPIVPEV